jgi:CTP:molybdopterin cytidylyltransferase MocA
MTTGEPRTFACVIPAAGEGARFGHPKAEAELAPGVRFLDRVVAIAAGCGADPIVAVVRPGVLVPAPAVQVDGSPTGDQIGSIRRGLARLASSSVRGTLVWPVDHPYVAVATANAVADGFRRSGAPIVVPIFEGRRGHPVLFARETWLDLMTAADGGARSVVHRHGAAVLEVEVDDPNVLRDVDTRADLIVQGETDTDARTGDQRNDP